MPKPLHPSHSPATAEPRMSTNDVIGKNITLHAGNLLKTTVIFSLSSYWMHSDLKVQSLANVPTYKAHLLNFWCAEARTFQQSQT